MITTWNSAREQAVRFTPSKRTGTHHTATPHMEHAQHTHTHSHPHMEHAQHTQHTHDTRTPHHMPTTPWAHTTHTHTTPHAHHTTCPRTPWAPSHTPSCPRHTHTHTRCTYDDMLKVVRAQVVVGPVGERWAVWVWGWAAVMQRTPSELDPSVVKCKSPTCRPNRRLAG